MDKFAGYLTTVVDELEKEHGIQFDTIEPFNEPNTNYWSTNIPSGQTWPTSASRQEGAHIGRSARTRWSRRSPRAWRTRTRRTTP